MKLGAKRDVPGNSNAKYDVLKRKLGEFRDGDPVTIYEFERIAHDGSVIDTYQIAAEEVNS